MLLIEMTGVLSISDDSRQGVTMRLRGSGVKVAETMTRVIGVFLHDRIPVRIFPGVQGHEWGEVHS
jgi:hypothetical protein